MSEGKILSEEMLDAAVGVLGAMLIDKEAVGPMLMKLDDADFLDGTYRLIFQAFRHRYNAGEPVDPLLINQTLGGGYSKLLSQIMEVTSTAANADAYADALKQAFRLYQLRQLGTALSEAKDEDKCREVIDQANLLFSQHTGIKRVSLAQSVQDFFQRHSRTSPPDSLNTTTNITWQQIYIGNDRKRHCE